MAVSDISERQAAIVYYIKGYIATRGYAPSMREIGKAMHLSSTGHTSYHMVVLERKGYISREANMARAMRVLREPGERARELGIEVGKAASA